MTQAQAIEKIAAAMKGPMALVEFVDQVLSLWPSKAKDPQASVRQTIRNNYLGKRLLFLDDETLMPMPLAMAGIRFRLVLTRQETSRGWLFSFPAFQYMGNLELSVEDFQFEDEKGQPIPANPVTVTAKEQTIFGLETYERRAFDLGAWYTKQNLKRGDGLLVTILDWENGRFQLQTETARQRQKHKAEIQKQNQRLADLLFQILETARYESVSGQEAIPKAYLHHKAQAAYPADHWFAVLEQDPRMHWTGYDIRYPDSYSPFEAMINDLTPSLMRPESTPAEKIGEEEAVQVFRFKASLWHRKGLWRRIEIQGGQTLADFDAILREAFEHDTFDHLSGFWKLVRRGKSRRFREVDLGTINPFEGGGAGDVQIAALGLAPGDSLKYVYDFGDWVEHRIELEAIGEAEAGASYPDVVAQNRRRHRRCTSCAEAGRKSNALWVCITCCNDRGEDVFLCDSCLDEHEDHYYTKILY
jgi:hypothetical protein